MGQTGTIHSVDTGFIYVDFKLSFSKQYKIQCFNLLDQGSPNVFVRGLYKQLHDNSWGGLLK